VVLVFSVVDKWFRVRFVSLDRVCTDYDDDGVDDDDDVVGVDDDMAHVVEMHQ
jgi:hypothetical protein